MVYGPYFAYRTGSELNSTAARIPGSFENKVRKAVLNKYGSINSGKLIEFVGIKKLPLVVVMEWDKAVKL